MRSSASSQIVLDASAFYAGIPFLSNSFLSFCTTSEVLEEVKHIKGSISAIDTLIDAGSLAISEPKHSSVLYVRHAAEKTGDSRLSVADISVLALAYEKNVDLMSDDYSVANVAAQIGLNIKSSTGKGIRQARVWITYCSGCSRAFGSNLKTCPLCGNRLARRYKSKKLAD